MTKTEWKAAYAKALKTRNDFKRRYLESIKYFRNVSHDYCIRKVLCTTSAEQGKMHCARPAISAFRHKDARKFAKHGIKLVCMSCEYDVQVHLVGGLPKDSTWCDEHGNPVEKGDLFEHTIKSVDMAAIIEKDDPAKIRKRSVRV